MPPDNNQTAQRSVHGNQIPLIGRVETPYLLAGTPDTGYALRGATEPTCGPRLLRPHSRAVGISRVWNSPVSGQIESRVDVRG
jgi:hypothetical protein